MAKLDINFGSNGYQKISKQVTDLDRDTEKLRLEKLKLQKQIKDLDKTVDSFAKSELDLTKKLIDNTIKTKENARSQRQLERQLNNTSTSTFNFSKTLGILGGAFALIQIKEFTQDIINVGIQFESLQASLDASVGGAIQGQQAFSFLRDEAQRLGQDLQSSVDGFKQLSASAKGTTLGAEDVKDVFTAVSEASKVMQLSVDDTNGVFRALSQIMSKGTVQSEELKGQIGERIPGAFNIASRAMGVTTKELGKMLEQGQLVADDFLPKFADELERTFSKDVAVASQTLASDINRFNNALTESKKAIAESGLNDLAQKFTKIGTASLDSFNDILFGFRAIGDLKTIDDLNRKLGDLGDEYKKVEESVNSDNFFKKTKSDLRLVESNIVATTDLIIKLQGRLEASKEASLKSIAERKEEIEKAKELLEIEKQLKKEADAKAEADRARYERNTRNYNEYLKQIAEERKETEKQIAKLEKNLSVENDNVFGFLSKRGIEDFIKGMEKLQEQGKITAKELEKANEKALKAKITQERQSYLYGANVLAEGIEAGIKGSGVTDAFKKIFDTFGDDLLRSSLAQGQADFVKGGLSGLTSGGSLYGIAGGIALGAVGSLFGNKGPSFEERRQEKSDNAFNEFIENLNKASEALNNFGNTGTSLEGQISSLQDEIARRNEAIVNPESETFNYGRTNFLFDGREISTFRRQNYSEFAEGETQYQSQAEADRETQRLRAEAIKDFEDFLSGEINTYSQELSSILKEQVSNNLDFSVFDTSELTQITGITDIEKFNEDYASVVKSINEIGIDIKQAQQAGKTDEEINKLADSLTNLYTSEIFIQGQDFEEAIKILTEAREEETEAIKQQEEEIKNNKETLERRLALLKLTNEEERLQFLREEELNNLKDENNKKLLEEIFAEEDRQKLLNEQLKQQEDLRKSIEEDRQKLLNEQLKQQEDLRKSIEATNSTLDKTINDILGIGQNANDSKFKQLSRFNQLTSQFKTGTVEEQASLIGEITALGKTLGQDTTLSAGIVDTLSGLKTVTSDNQIITEVVAQETIGQQNSVVSSNSEALLRQQLAQSREDNATIRNELLEIRKLLREVTNGGNAMRTELVG